MAFAVQTVKENFELDDLIQTLIQEVWPRFMLESNAANRFWRYLSERFADFQFALIDGDTVVAAGNALPIRWNGSLQDLPDGWDAALQRGVTEYERDITPNTLCALSMSVAPSHQGQRLSRIGLEAMRSLAKAHGLGALIAPVRPTLKSRYPLTPIVNYVTWVRANGALFDPWLRTHERLGATIMRVAPVSMTIRGTVSEWETWTQMRLPESGKYIVSGALQPVEIDLERNTGHYEDPNVWMHHALYAT